MEATFYDGAVMVRSCGAEGSVSALSDMLISLHLMAFRSHLLLSHQWATADSLPCEAQQPSTRLQNMVGYINEGPDEFREPRQDPQTLELMIEHCKTKSVPNLVGCRQCSSCMCA